MNNDKFNFITKEQAKNGAECRWRKYNMITSAVLAAIFSVFPITIVIVLTVTPPQIELGEIIAACIALFILLVGPFGGLSIYNCVQYRRVINAVDRCPVYRVTLDKPHGSYMYRGSVYYTVEFQTDEGSVSINTTAIFATYGWLVPFEMSEYNNKDVYVIYDKAREKVYVVDLVEKIDV